MNKKKLSILIISLVLTVAAIGLTAGLLSRGRAPTTDNSVTITFNDGSSVLKTDSVNNGGTISTTFIPQKTGKRFVGWYVDDACTIPFEENTHLTDDVILYASWEDLKFTIKYVDADGERLQEVVYGEDAIAPPIRTKLGFDVVAPYWDNDGLNVTENVTINAVYTANLYSVTYVDDSGSHTQSVRYGENAIAPEITVRTGHSAVWDNDGTSITSTLTITAVYTANLYSVTYVDDSGSHTQSVSYGGNAIPPAITVRNGYTAVWDNDGTSITDNKTINAIYTQIKSSLKFNLGNETVYSKENVAAGASIQAYSNDAQDNLTVPSGLLFDCWCSDSALTSVVDFESVTMPDTATTYYARLKLGTINNANAAADNATKPYGQSFTLTASADEDVGITYTYEWFYNQTSQGLGKTLTVSSLTVGSYDYSVKVTASYSNTQDVYTVKTVTLTVLTATIAENSIKVDDVLADYDNAAHSFVLPASVLASDTVTFRVGDSGEFTNTAPSFTTAGSYTVYFKVARTYYYDYVTSATLTIKKIVLTARVNDTTATYGGTLPEFSVTYSGYADGDNFENVDMSGEVVYLHDFIGSYHIGDKVVSADVSGLSAINYNFEAVSGTITFNKAAATVSADDASVTYGDAAPRYTYTISGLLGEDTLFGTPIINSEYSAGSAVGNYNITISGFSSDYYDVSYENGILSVGAKAVSIAANPSSVTYGDDVPALSATVTGLFGEDVINYTVTTDYVKGAAKGTYAITVDYTQNENYTVSTVGGVLTVSTKAVTLSVSEEFSYDGENAWTKTDWSGIDGLVSGDLASGTLATVSYEVGVYDEVSDFIWTLPFDVKNNGISVLSSYTFTYEFTVEIIDKSIDYVASDYSGAYDADAHGISVVCNVADTVITYSIDGNEYSTENPTFTNAGTYTVYFKITHTLGVLNEVSASKTVEITAASLTITANSFNVNFGDAIPTYTYTAVGFVGDETSSVLGGKIACKCAYVSGANVGSYDIIPSGLTSSNYNINYVKGTVTVAAKSAAVVWEGLNGVYTYSAIDQSASITAKISGADGDIPLTVAFNNKIADFKNAGTYEVTASLANTNYELTNNSKSVTMNKGNYIGITHRELSGTYSPTQTLSNITLDEGFKWANTSVTPVCATTSYAATYCADPANYNVFNTNVTLRLAKATAVISGELTQAYNYDNAAHGMVNLAAQYNGNNITETVSYTYSAGNSFTAAGTYKTVLTAESANYKSAATNCFIKIRGVKMGDSFYTVEEALYAAQSGNIAIVTTNTSFATDADVRATLYPAQDYYTIDSGVQLLVPFDDEYTSSMEEYIADEASATLGTVYSVLTIPDGITVTISNGGTLNVNAKRGRYSTPFMGHTIERYGRLDLYEGATINVSDGAVLNCNGYIVGKGLIDAASGATVYDVLAIKDFRGGTVTYNIYNNCFPFNEYTFNNIEANLKIHSGAMLYARYYIYASTAVNGVFSVIGDGAVFDLDSGYIMKSFDTSTGRDTLDVYGEAHTNYAELNIKVQMFFFPINVAMSTENLEFPLTGNLTINIKNQSVMNLNNKFKLLPGAQVNVEQGATCNVNSAATLYTYGGDATDPAYGTGYSISGYGEATTYSHNRITAHDYTANSLALLTVGGTLNVTGKIGGIVRASEGGVLNLTGASALTGTTQEQTGDNKDALVEFDVTFTAKGYVNGDKTQTVALTKSRYVANGTTWVLQ